MSNPTKENILTNYEKEFIIRIMKQVELNPSVAKKHKEEHYAVDFDGVLAHYSSWEEQGNQVGKPIQPMIKKVKSWLRKGIKVSIFTARLTHGAIESEKQILLIQNFLRENDLPDNLQITPLKMSYFTHFVDDRAYHVIPNTGIIEGNMGI